MVFLSEVTKRSKKGDEGSEGLMTMMCYSVNAEKTENPKKKILEQKAPRSIGDNKASSKAKPSHI